MPADSFESPLTLAACGGHIELANLLIERGANLEEVNDEGYTPLMEAAREGHEEMVALLLAHGRSWWLIVYDVFVAQFTLSKSQYVIADMTGRVCVSPLTTSVSLFSHIFYWTWQTCFQCHTYNPPPLSICHDSENSAYFAEQVNTLFKGGTARYSVSGSI